MKKKTKAILGIFPLLGLFTASSFAFLSSKPSVKPLSADPTIEKTIYLDLSLEQTYLNKPNNPYLVYQDETEHRIELALLENGIYKASSKIPLEVFENPEYSFDVCIDFGENSTSIITIEGDNPLKESHYNYLYLSSAEEGVNKQYGYYGNRVENPDATYATQRVWFHGASTGERDYQLGVGYEVEGVFYTLIMPSLVNSQNGEAYFYGDIPCSLASLSFLKIKGEKSHDFIIDFLIDVPVLSYGVCYHENPVDGSVAPHNVNGATATMLKYVVDAFLTYGKNPSNGADKNTIINLYSTWFANKSASSEELKQTKIIDYTGYSSNGNSYEGLVKNSEFSVNEKWNALCSQAGIDPNTGRERSFSFGFADMKTSLLICFGAIAVLFVIEGAVILIRRRS